MHFREPINEHWMATACILQVLIAESYGGRDEPVDTLTNNFVGVGVEPALEAVRVREEPNEATYQVSITNFSLSLHALTALTSGSAISVMSSCLSTSAPDPQMLCALSKLGRLQFAYIVCTG